MSGPDLPDVPLAVAAGGLAAAGELLNPEALRTLSPQPGPYSEGPGASLVASRDARIRELEAEVARLRETAEAARLFVEVAVDPAESVVLTCGFCDQIATTLADGGSTRCDEHPNGGEDLSYAPAWRRLRKAVER